MPNDSFYNIFSIVNIIIPILVIGIFAFTFTMMFNPKLRGKMMSKQNELLKQMTNFSKQYLENIGNTMNEIAINRTKSKTSF